MSWTIGRAEVKFLSTPSARRATHDKGLQRRVKEYFYPRPPRGGRRQDIFYDLQAEPFLSTPSARRATTEEVRPALFILFLSTPSARRATSDGRHTGSLHSDFYPRPPRGGRPGCAVNKSNQNKFLSTPSARRARPWRKHHIISIHALREEGDAPSGRNTPDIPNFYPRPPRGGRPLRFAVTAKRQKDFYPRPPRGGRPFPHGTKLTASQISIHALREEGDSCLFIAWIVSSDFYPRPPRGGRPVSVGKADTTKAISIHALREEGDPRTAGTR